jgi:murein DD-endopeptidase MepM/ murein hydrolase activator NlpD
MRLRLYTRALTAILAVLGLASLRAMPAGSGHERPLPQEPTISAAALLPVAAVDATFPATPEATPAPGLIWPAPGAITSPFGGGRHHPGIDIDGVTGDPAFAAGSGTVIDAGPAPSGYSGYGNMVLIDHGGGLSTLYAHLSRVDVAVGQVVQQGQQIGAIGSTGFATGDHLHFEVRVDNKPEDPIPHLPAR